MEKKGRVTGRRGGGPALKITNSGQRTNAVKKSGEVEKQTKEARETTKVGERAILRVKEGMG